MRIDLKALRIARLLKISSPGEWVSLTVLTERYNRQYHIEALGKHLPKLLMHERRLERILRELIEKGQYEHDENRGYRFLTHQPNKR